jgi:diguanylate cyclase
LSASQVLPGDSRVMQTISRYLETLRDTVDGDELHGLIARTLRRHSRNGPLGIDYLTDLYGQLDAYARDPLTLASMRIRARLLQQHIAPYLQDLRAGAAAPARVVSKPDKEPAVRAAGAAAPAATGARNGVEVSVEAVLERPAEQQEQAANDRVKRYQDLLRSEKDAWQAIYGTVKDYQRLKDAWLKSLDELAQQRDALEEKLAKTTEALSSLEVEHERVREELAAARTPTARAGRPMPLPRLASRLGNRAAPLAKRDSFVRLLQAEIKRVKRSGAPLALGLISIESLDTMVERHGPEAASAALKCYADEILSNFRGYDIVALYERDRFAVMFPDTSKEGARRALEKAYKRAVETHLNCAGASIPLPPFAGALVTYSPGEDPARFLGRADEALSNARTSGQRGVLLS